MAASQYHLLLEDGSYLLTEDGLSHILLEDAPSLSDEHDGATVARGDDAGGVAHNTGRAREALYDRQIREIEERITSLPTPKTAKKRRKRMAALETALALLPAPAMPEVYSRETIIDRLDAYDGSADRYELLMAEAEAYMEQVMAAQAARRARNRMVAMAMAMLMAG